MNQENVLKAQIMEQEGNQLNQQLELISQNVNELNEVKSSLIEIEKKDCKEMLANIGKKIFIPAEIKEKKLYIDVGNKVVLEKTPLEAIKIIDEQIEKLEIAKNQVTEELDKLHLRVQELLNNVSKKKDKKD